MTFPPRPPRRLLAALAGTLLAAGAAAALASAAASTPLDMPQPRSGPRPSAADVARWQDRKFGMFIHFGLYSTLGGVWDGRRVPGYAEQIEANAPVLQAQYDALAKRFDPTHFDPDAIVALAKAAGMRYIVLTSKHHDGFALFGTHANRFNVVDDSPYRRDIVKQLADACARVGMPFGVYYSTIDWHWMHGQFMRSNSNPISPAQAAFNVEQIKELMHDYGPIAEFWFDMGQPTPAQSALFARTVHGAQPATMASGRVWNYAGDFVVPDDNQASGVEVEVPWEAAASIFADTWGYRAWQQRTDLEGKIHQKIRQLVEVASRGGNYLLNVGPEGNGSIVPYEADVLRGIGARLKPRGEAIYDTRGSPFGMRKLDFGYATASPHALHCSWHTRQRMA